MVTQPTRKCNVIYDDKKSRAVTARQTSQTFSIVKPTRCTNVSNLFYFGIALHVSDGFPVHRQEFKTVHTSTGICQTDTAVCLLASRQTELCKSAACPIELHDLRPRAVQRQSSVVNFSFAWISFHTVLIPTLAAVEGKCLQLIKTRNVVFMKVGTPTRRNRHVHLLA
jgi:hypothetical protein